VNWNNGQTDDVAKPSGDASKVTCDFPYCGYTAGDVVYKEKAITGTEAVPHTCFVLVLWIHRVKPGSNRKYICTDHSAFCLPGHGRFVLSAAEVWRC